MVKQSLEEKCGYIQILFGSKETIKIFFPLQKSSLLKKVDLPTDCEIG